MGRKEWIEVYEIPPEPPPQTKLFKVMKEAKEVYKKFLPVYKEYIGKIDDLIVEMILKLDELANENSLKTMDVVTTLLIIDRILTEIYNEIAKGRVGVMRKVLEKLGFKLTI